MRDAVFFEQFGKPLQHVGGWAIGTAGVVTTALGEVPNGVHNPILRGADKVMKRLLNTAHSPLGKAPLGNVAKGATYGAFGLQLAYEVVGYFHDEFKATRQARLQAYVSEMLSINAAMDLNDTKIETLKQETEDAKALLATLAQIADDQYAAYCCDKK